MVGQLGRDGYVEIGDDDLHSVLVGAVEILMDVLFADEIAVFA